MHPIGADENINAILSGLEFSINWNEGADGYQEKIGDYDEYDK